MRNPLSGLFKERTFFKKLIIGMFIIAVIPTFITVTMMYNTYSGRMVDEISRSNLMMLGQIRIYIEAVLDEIESVSINSGLDRELLYFSQNHFTQDATGFNNLSSKIASMNQSNKNIDSIFVYFDKFGYIMGNPSGLSYGFYYIDKVKDTSWQQPYHSGITYHLIIRELPDGRGQSLSFLKPIKDVTMKTQGVMVIDVALNNIFSKLEKIKTHSLEDIYVSDAEGKIVFQMGDSYNSEVANLLGQLKPGQDGYFESKQVKEKKVIAYTVSSDGWKYISVTNEKELLKKISLYKNLTILIALMIITASIVFSLLYGRYLYNPISRIIRNIANGNVTNIKHGDEIQDINNAFNHMLDIKNNLQKLVDDNKNIMKNKLLNNILFGYGYTSEELSQKLRFFDINMPFEWFCVLLVRADISNYNKDKSQQMTWKIYVLTLIEQLLEKNNINGIVFETNFENISVLINFNHNEIDDIRQVLQYFSSNLRETLAATTPVNISIGAGNPVNGIERIFESYQQAVMALDYRTVLGRNSIVFIDDILDSKYINLQGDKYEKSIDLLVQSRDKEGLKALAGDISDEIGSNKAVTHESIVDFLIQIISYSVKALEKANMVVYRNFIDETPLYTDFLKNDTMEDMVQWLQQLFDKIMKVLSESDNKKNGYAKVVRAEKYILENFHNELTLNSVAEIVGLNPNYLSNAFKEVTGKSFIDYLNLLRVEKSKELLEGSQLTISDVAAKVGFSNDRTLARNFKKYEGCTPGMYRENLLNIK